MQKLCTRVRRTFGFHLCIHNITYILDNRETYQKYVKHRKKVRIMIYDITLHKQMVYFMSHANFCLFLVLKTSRRDNALQSLKDKGLHCNDYQPLIFCRFEFGSLYKVPLLTFSCRRQKCLLILNKSLALMSS